MVKAFHLHIWGKEVDSGKNFPYRASLQRYLVESMVKAFHLHIWGKEVDFPSTALVSTSCFLSYVLISVL